MEENVNRNLNNSLYDGVFANMFATLTGGVFLTGFALYLGMNEFMIGLIASMPFLVTIFQLPASYLIAKSGKRKKISFWAAASARIIWVPILVVTFFPISPVSIKILIILSLILLSHAFASISYVSWLSWLSDLVPEEMRGRFFGTRNMLCGAAGMIAMVVFGRLLDSLNGHSRGQLPLGFGITFISAVLFGIVSLRFLNRISELQQASWSASSIPLRLLLFHPFKERNFRNLLIFALSWGFSVNFASPFFTLYFLRDLKFSYGFVAALGMLSAFADLMGMQLWGRISDKVKNKAVIQFTSWVAIFLPLAWVWVRPGDVIGPIILHIFGGGFWAGIHLCMNNLLLRISPRQNRASFISFYNILGGIGSAIGPISAGLILHSIHNLDLYLFSWKLLPLQLVFVVSTLFRLLSFQLFKYVHEPEEIPVQQMVRVLRSVRGLNIATGFNYLLHPFIEITGGKPESKT